jgi:hypothetical protein
MNEFASKNENPIDLSKISEPLRGTAEKALAAGRDVQAAAVDLANSSTEALKGNASELMDAAKDIASHAGDRIQEKVSEQKGAGADYVNSLADTMRRAAGEFDADIPLAGTYIRKAAAQVESAANALREGNLNDLVQGAQSFARNQPTAFLGLAVLAGFGVVRFLKSSTAPSGLGAEVEPGGGNFQQSRQPTQRAANSSNYQ